MSPFYILSDTLHNCRHSRAGSATCLPTRYLPSIANIHLSISSIPPVNSIRPICLPSRLFHFFFPNSSSYLRSSAFICGQNISFSSICENSEIRGCIDLLFPPRSPFPLCFIVTFYHFLFPIPAYLPAFFQNLHFICVHLR